MGLEESGPPEGRVKKCPVDIFLARGRVLFRFGHIPAGCGRSGSMASKEAPLRGALIVWGAPWDSKRAARPKGG